MRIAIRTTFVIKKVKPKQTQEHVKQRDYKQVFSSLAFTQVISYVGGSNYRERAHT